MRKVAIAIVVLLMGSAMNAPKTGKDVIKTMYEKYGGKWYKTFSFNQTTEIYKNDSLIRSQTWYEQIEFPKNFRIDFGNADSGNAVIFRNDSSYIFKNSKLARTNYYQNDLLFLLGGMYFYPLDSAISKMEAFGFDLHKFHEDSWKGKAVYVIGAKKNEDSVNQVWFEKENYNLVRMIKFENNRKEEALLENQVKLKGGFSETLVKFYIDDNLIQVEKYHDLKSNIYIDPSVFDPKNFRKNSLQQTNKLLDF
jgi:hypothetical protein